MRRTAGRERLQQIILPRGPGRGSRRGPSRGGSDDAEAVAAGEGKDAGGGRGAREQVDPGAWVDPAATTPRQGQALWVVAGQQRLVNQSTRRASGRAAGALTCCWRP